MFLIISSVFLFMLPLPLFGWGGVAHFYFGSLLLDNLSLVSSETALLLARYPYDFLYGLVLADIIIGKRYTTWENHSHNWKVAFSLFSLAEKEHNLAFIWGYLSHLAADVIAHNFFLPEMFIRYFHGKMKNHSYWELKFETCFDHTIWDDVARIGKMAHSDNDALLKRGLQPTLFSYSTNRRLFDLMNLQRRLKSWRKFMKRLSERSVYKIPEDRYHFYMKRSVDAMIDVLSEGEDAFIVGMDPTGKKALKTGFRIKKDLRRLRKEKVSDEIIQELILENLPEIPPGKFSGAMGEK